MKALTFRPHHFLCSLGFQGKGYSDEFVTGFQSIVDLLRAPQGDGTVIKVTDFTDSICAPCPHKRGDLCETQSRITQLDVAHAKVLGLSAGDQVSWGEIKERIKEKISLETFHTICEGCPWKELGVCEKALKELKSKS